MAKDPKVKIDLHKVFLFWRDIARKYEKIKQDPEKSEKDVSLGISSLCMSICGTAMAIAFAYFAFKCFTWTGDTALSAAKNGLGGIFVIIGGVICAVIAVASFVYLILASILYANFQRKLNKQKIGTIALIVSLLLSVGTIVTVIVLAILLFAL